LRNSLTQAASPRVLALVALNGVLAACVLSCAWRGTQAAALLATPPLPVQLPEYDLTRPVSQTRLATIEDRTLLYASRHVYVATPPDLAPPRPNYRLVGTFIIPSKPAVALLTNPQDASRKVKPGDTLDGWLVEGVERHRVLLRHDSETFEIADAVPAGTGLVVQRAPLARLAPSTPEVGVRVLGQPTSNPANAASSVSPRRSAPRLYQPPPKP
jgi:hypothetical protein